MIAIQEKVKRDSYEAELWWGQAHVCRLKVGKKSEFVKAQISNTVHTHARTHTHRQVPETMFLVCSFTSLGVSLKDE